MAEQKKYPLEPLMEIRRQALDAAKGQLDAAIRTSAQKLTEVTAQELSLRKCAARIHASLLTLSDSDRSGTLSARTYAARQRHLDRLRDEYRKRQKDCAACRGELEVARQLEDKARERLRKAHQDLEILSRHKGRFQESVVAEIQKAEEEACEEAAQAACWQRQNRPDPDGPGTTSRNQR